MRDSSAKRVALGGVFSALGVVVMCLGGLIPVATYVCPMICALLVFAVMHMAGKKIAWCCYVVIALLSALLCPDKEAAGVFVFLGYYPIVKPSLEAHRAAWLWKLLLFNAATLVLYALLIFLFDMRELASELQSMGTALLVLTLVLGNAAFFLLDFLLTILFGKIRRANG